MATSTGKKARKSGGTKVACKRAKARTRKHKTFGKVPVGPGAVVANESFADRVYRERRNRGIDPEANGYVPLA